MLKSADPDQCIAEFFIMNGEPIRCSLFKTEFCHTGTVFYEVLKMIQGVPLFVDDHIERLFDSLTNKGVTVQPSISLVVKNLKLLLTNNREHTTGNIRILLNYIPNSDNHPDVTCHFAPFYYPSEDEYLSGVKLVPVKAERVNLHSKVINKGFRDMVSTIILENGAYEALLINHRGDATEGSKSNFFAIKNDIVYTPPVDDVLPGITRKYIIEICKKLGIKTFESRIKFSELQSYTSCFISGTSPGVLPVSEAGEFQFDTKNRILYYIRTAYDSLTQDYINMNRSKLIKIT